MTTIRAFVAIELTDEAQAALLRLQSRLKPLAPPHSVRWTALQNIHLTLHFLGDMPADAVEKIGGSLNGVAATYRPFSLTVSGLGCFPDMRRPRIIWVGVMGQTNSLEALQRDLGVSLQNAIDFSPDTRPYAPHLTIGRVNQDIPTRQLTQLSQMLEQQSPTVGRLTDLQVTEISLMQSELKPTGAVYTPLYRGLLKA
jgi:2'-5' RNA ligase